MIKSRNTKNIPTEKAKVTLKMKNIQISNIELDKKLSYLFRIEFYVEPNNDVKECVKTCLSLLKLTTTNPILELEEPPNLAIILR